MAEQEQAEAKPLRAPETVTLTVSRLTFEQLRALAARWGVSVDRALGRLVVDALSRGSTASSVAGTFPEGLSTDGLDPDEDAYWRELHALTRDEDARVEAAPGSAPAR
jgi:hypothetical protein